MFNRFSARHEKNKRQLAYAKAHARSQSLLTQEESIGYMNALNDAEEKIKQLDEKYRSQILVFRNKIEELENKEGSSSLTDPKESEIKPPNVESESSNTNSMDSVSSQIGAEPDDSNSNSKSVFPESSNSSTIVSEAKTIEQQGVGHVNRNPIESHPLQLAYNLSESVIADAFRQGESLNRRQVLDVDFYELPENIREAIMVLGFDSKKSMLKFNTLRTINRKGAAATLELTRDPKNFSKLQVMEMWYNELVKSAERENFKLDQLSDYLRKNRFLLV